jgi:hypothetical protein
VEWKIVLTPYVEPECFKQINNDGEFLQISWRDLALLVKANAIETGGGRGKPDQNFQGSADPRLLASESHQQLRVFLVGSIKVKIGKTTVSLFAHTL